MPRDNKTSAAAAASVPSRGMTAVVSLNDLAVAIEQLTSSRLRDIINAQGDRIDGSLLQKVANCGCDKNGDCGCFGSNCPCNVLHSGDEFEDPIDWIAVRDAKIEQLRQQLEELRAAEPRAKE